jgi:riboflavin transporter FmnP
MKSTKTIVMTGLMTAIGLVLPPIVRLIPNGGVWFSPMHIPVLLAGIAIGPLSGFLTGLICPLLNNLLFGMPQGNTLLGMMVELPVYGLVSGILMHVLKGKMQDGPRVYLSLIAAMTAGRIAGGIMQGLVLGVEGYSIGVWAGSYFAATAPAIVIHLILIPAVWFALKKAKLIQA